MSIQQRKTQHIDLAQNPIHQMDTNDWDSINLPYIALPEISLDEVDTSTTIFRKPLSQPLIVSSMTGGTKHSSLINKNIAIAAQSCGVAMGVGSMRVALDIESARSSFTIIRQHAPTAVVFANMGAVQLNYGKSIEDFQKVVDMIQADALYLHINPLQEAIQSEGDTNWKDLKSKISKLIKKISVPVYVKEVGHGLDFETCQFLIESGAAGIDIAGTGGTSWSAIEASRSNDDLFFNWFKNIGVSAPLVIMQLNKQSSTKLVASGGIRNPIQGLKSHLIGADYYASAYPFLTPALESPEKLIEIINKWQKGLKIAMFTSSIKSWNSI